MIMALICGRSQSHFMSYTLCDNEEIDNDNNPEINEVINKTCN